MLAAAPRIRSPFALALLLASETGHRIGSIRLLRWSDINLEQQTVHWRAESDKIGLDHTTPLSSTMVAALAQFRRRHVVEDDGWVVPSTHTPGEPCPRRTLLKWWTMAESLAEIPHVPGLGFHSLRRRFANDLKSTNLRDLCGLGGWKSHHTLLAVYQQPELDVMRLALAGWTQRRMDSRNGQQG